MPFVVTKTTVKATKIPTSSVDLGMDIAIYSRTSTAKQNSSLELSHTRNAGISKGKTSISPAGRTATASSSRLCSMQPSRREFELVLFWSLDRFSREGVFETLQYLQRLKAYGMGLDRY
jgi:DNA invertase Pin-like site-specific DNA recombinase